MCRSNQPFPHLMPDSVGKHVSMEVRKGHPVLLMTRQTRKELGQAIGNEFDSHGRQYQSQQPGDDVMPVVPRMLLTRSDRRSAIHTDPATNRTVSTRKTVSNHVAA